MIIPSDLISLCKYLFCYKIPEITLNIRAFSYISGPESRVKEKDDNLPSYDGFECDVFRAIQDHYDSTLKEPLMTFNMFKLLDLSKGVCWLSFTLHSTVLACCVLTFFFYKKATFCLIFDFLLYLEVVTEVFLRFS